MRYKLSNDARMDLARVYWRGLEEFGERQADRYYETLIQRFDDIAEAPANTRLLTTYAKATGVVSVVWTASTIGGTVKSSRSCAYLADKTPPRDFNHYPAYHIHMT